QAELKEALASPTLSKASRIHHMTQLMLMEQHATQRRLRDALLVSLPPAVPLPQPRAPSLLLPICAPHPQLSTTQFAKEWAENQNRVSRRQILMNCVTRRATDMGEYEKNQRRLVKLINKEIIRLVKSRTRKKERDDAKRERERMDALKMCDMDKYREMVSEMKNNRLSHLLGKTDEYLEQLHRVVITSTGGAAAQAQALMAGTEAKVEAEAKAHVHDDSEGEGDGNGELPSESESEGEAKAEGEEEEEGKDVRTRLYEEVHAARIQLDRQPAILGNTAHGSPCTLTLKPYQLEGLKWMASLYQSGLNGILADEMGLGKTIQTIALFSYLYEVKRIPGPFLVVCPLSVLDNWREEFFRWCPTLTVNAYTGPAKRRKMLAKMILHGQVNVVLTTYEFVVRDKAVFGKPNWVYTVVDEGHRMKNHGSQLSQVLKNKVTSGHRLVLTGTPLQNSLAELWSLLNFILPAIFDSVDNFEAWFNAPFSGMTDKQDIDESQISQEERLLIIDRLHSVLRPFLLRRLKLDVLSQLPPKKEIIIKVPLSKWQSDLYAKAQRRGVSAVISRDGGSSKVLTNAAMQLRKITNHPFLMTDMEAGPETEATDDIWRQAGKFELLDRILPKMIQTKHRILIFSQFRSLLDWLGVYLQFRDCPFLRLDGTTKAEERAGLLEAFNEKDSPYVVFLLSTRAGGLGLNLQTADTVILFDSDWNPQRDLQAQDRAHRIGQTSEVRVLRFCTATPIEEKILETAARKMDINNAIIHAGKFDKSETTSGERKAVISEVLNAVPVDYSKVSVQSHSELNRQIARTPDEMTLFEQIDREMEGSRREAHLADLDLPSDTPIDVMPTPARLAEEPPEWYIPEPDLPPPSAQDLVNITLTKRRGRVNYAEKYTDDQYARLLDQGVNPYADRGRTAAPATQLDMGAMAGQSEGAEVVDVTSQGEGEVPVKKTRGRKPSKSKPVVRPPLPDPLPPYPVDIPGCTDDKSLPALKLLWFVGKPETSSRAVAGQKCLILKAGASVAYPKGLCVRLGPGRRKVSPGDLFFVCSVLAVLYRLYLNPAAAEYATLPDRTLEPDYYDKVKRPVSLSSIRKKALRREYVRLAEVKYDFTRMLKNGILFNGADEERQKGSEALQAVFDGAVSDYFLTPNGTDTGTPCVRTHKDELRAFACGLSPCEEQDCADVPLIEFGQGSIAGEYAPVQDLGVGADSVDSPFPSVAPTPAAGSVCTSPTDTLKLGVKRGRERKGEREETGDASLRDPLFLTPTVHSAKTEVAEGEGEGEREGVAQSETATHLDTHLDLDISTPSASPKGPVHKGKDRHKVERPSQLGSSSLSLSIVLPGASPKAKRKQ
ncbi:hypothetical protein KIPB_007278, partial [Kipferlia bialata]